MTDELSIEGKQYISSKRAADLSGYAQDYVGQLARKGLIDAQRIGGLWYVFMESLAKYKEKADTYVPVPPQATFKNENPDTLISFDGNDYVSAARAAEITGYHQDYVGQLARSGKILSRQVGNRWYVDRDGIVAHKEEKDNLLGAVQSQAVGIKPLEPKKEPYIEKIESWEPLNYRNDAGALIPELPERAEPQEENAPEEPKEEVVAHVPIRIIENKQRQDFIVKKDHRKIDIKRARMPGKTIFYSVFSILALAAAATFLLSSTRTTVARYANSVGDILEPIVTKELKYSQN